MKNILIPLELSNSELENRVIEISISYAKILEAKCWIIHVVKPNPELDHFKVGPQYVRDQLAADMRKEHKQVQLITEQFNEHKIDTEGLLIQGATAKMIKDEITKLDIDLLIIGNKKHKFLESLFSESISEELINHVKVPILLIPDIA